MQHPLSSIRILAFIFIISCISGLHNGLQAQQLVLIKPKGNNVAKMDDRLLKPKELKEIMQFNAEASASMNKYNSNFVPAYGLSAVGGGLIGWPIGTAIGGGDPNWTLAIVGAGLVVIAIPLGTAAKKHLKSAVDSYNSGLAEFSPEQQPRMQYAISFGNNGLGLALRF